MRDLTAPIAGLVALLLIAVAAWVFIPRLDVGPVPHVEAPR